MRKVGVIRWFVKKACERYFVMVGGRVVKGLGVGSHMEWIRPKAQGGCVEREEYECQIVDNCKKGLGYNAVPPPYTGNFMPPTPDLSFTSLKEFISEPVVIKHVVENSEAKASKAKPKAVRKNNGAPIIED
ncbi:hypothetical protein Tco_0418175 [Tanacetum coccineum]